MAERKSISSVDASLKIHEAQCAERWKTIYRKTDDLQASMQSMKSWLLAGLTTIIASLFTLIIRGLI